MNQFTRVSVGQSSVALGRVDANLDRVTTMMQAAANCSSDVVILPELTLTGYMFADREACFAASLSVHGPEIESLIAVSDRLGVSAIVGFLERSKKDVFNTVAVISPGGLLHRYRKAHLPPLGADRFIDPGQDVPVVFELNGLRIGLCVCYDLRFPEWCRSLALLGADLIAVPTNWTAGAQVVSDHFVPTRAAENGIFLAIANRNDSELGAEFIGNSRIVNPAGQTVVVARGPDDLVFADIDPLMARGSSAVADGSYALDTLNDRRSELYFL